MVGKGTEMSKSKELLCGEQKVTKVPERRPGPDSEETTFQGAGVAGPQRYREASEQAGALSEL